MEVFLLSFKSTHEMSTTVLLIYQLRNPKSWELGTAVVTLLVSTSHILVPGFKPTSTSFLRFIYLKSKVIEEAEEKEREG